MKQTEIDALESFATAHNGPWAAIGPETGHPVPNNGARLCKRIPDVGWVVVSMGHQRVMEEIAKKANRSEQQVAQSSVQEIAKTEGYPKAIGSIVGVSVEENT